MSREAGKGSKPRPFSVNRNTFESNWDRIFGDKMKIATKPKTTKPVTVKLVNPLNQEEWLCEDYNRVEYIDGVEYVRVKKLENNRSFLMRKDALRKA